MPMIRTGSKSRVAEARQAILLLTLAAWALPAAADDRIEDSPTDRQPAITRFPDYPSIARRDRIEGDATVCFVIDARGRVRKAKVRDYSHKIFRKPALRAARASTFEPLAEGDPGSRDEVCRIYRFSLEAVVAGEQR